MTDLFDYQPSYPASPGFKGIETSFQAAQTVDAKTLQRLVLTELGKAPGTADEIADRLRIDKLSIRPRCSELKRLRLICDSGERRVNASGRSAAVFRLAA